MLHKLSTDLVRSYDLIVIKDLAPTNMVKNYKLAGLFPMFHGVSSIGSWSTSRNGTGNKSSPLAAFFRPLSYAPFAALSGLVQRFCCSQHIWYGGTRWNLTLGETM